MFWGTPTKSREGGDGLNHTVNGHDLHLALYKYDSCPFCQRVFQAIDQLGISVEYRDTSTHPAHRSQLMSDTGRTTVPCLYVDGKAMFESSDIIQWLNANARPIGGSERSGD